jgi:hypothetical protein
VPPWEPSLSHNSSSDINFFMNILTVRISLIMNNGDQLKLVLVKEMYRLVQMKNEDEKKAS